MKGIIIKKLRDIQGIRKGATMMASGKMMMDSDFGVPNAAQS
jgi:hypothetical protein